MKAKLRTTEETSSDLIPNLIFRQIFTFAVLLCPHRHFYLLLPVFECFSLPCRSAVHGSEQSVAPLPSSADVQTYSDLTEFFSLHLSRSILDETFPVLQSVCIVCKVPHLPLHHAMSPLRPLGPVSFHSAFTLSCWSPHSIPRYISQSNLHPPFPCGTKLIEDDWFFPGCSDSALETRQQELEEELAQARGLGQHRAKKLAAPSQRSLQVSGPSTGTYMCPTCRWQSS